MSPPRRSITPTVYWFVDMLAQYRNRGTVIVVTHDPEMLRDADHILIMRDGRAVDWVTPPEAHSLPRCRRRPSRCGKGWNLPPRVPRFPSRSGSRLLCRQRLLESLLLPLRKEGAHKVGRWALREGMDSSTLHLVTASPL